jgi:hypothetical protein
LIENRLARSRIDLNRELPSVKVLLWVNENWQFYISFKRHRIDNRRVALIKCLEVFIWYLKSFITDSV